MTIFTVSECLTCKASLQGELGAYYCRKCVKVQQAAYREEREAFVAFHRFADRAARSTR